MILTVTCNPAVDVTYDVEDLTPGAVHRVDRVAERAGGKGVNVARVLHQLGQPVHALGLADAAFGSTVEALGVRSTFVVAMPRMRRTVVVRGQETTSLWEPGHPVDQSATEDLLALAAAELLTATTLVVSGSLPPGMPADLPARLAALARNAGVPVVLDLDDAALAHAVEVGGAILCPNTDELGRLVGADVDPVDAARSLSVRTGAPVVLTRGELGLLAAADGHCWSVAPPRRVSGNPTGAGDATAAGIALGLAQGWDWPTTLTHAVSLGAAAVLTPVAGEVDLDAYRAFLLDARPERVDTALPTPNAHIDR